MPKISELNEITSLYANDYFAVAHDLNGLPSTKKITVNNLADTLQTYANYANNTSAGVILVGNNLTVNSTGYLSATGGGGGNGYTGSQGSSGTNGYTGSQGSAGTNGYTGSKGSTGYNGSIGSLGYTGSQGIIGYTGSFGPTGGSYGQMLVSSGNGSSVWMYNPGVDQLMIENYTTTYTASNTDNYIFCDPNDPGSITVILPSSPPQGKEYNIKNLTGVVGVKYVTVTTDQPTQRYLENPETGQFVQSYIIANRGDMQSWIHDGSVYRHIGSQTGVPSFITSANNYTQVVVKNSSNGVNASGDIVVYSDTADYTVGNGPFIDMGIDSSRYSNSFYSIFGPNDAYVYTGNANLLVGTSTPNSSIKLFTGTTDNTASMWIFNEYGTLTLPTLNPSASPAISSIKSGNNITIKANVNTYSFGSNGTLTFPSGGKLMSGWPSVGYIKDVVTLYAGQVYTTDNNANNYFAITAENAQIGSSSQTWYFESGVMRFPDSSNQLTAFNTNYQYTWANNQTFSGNVITTSGKFIGDGSLLTNLTVTQQANIVGSQANVSLIAGNYSYIFDNTGTFTMPANGDIVLPGASANLSVGGTVFASNYTSYTGSWTLSTGTNSKDFSVPGPGTYTLWVNGNVPNGILTYIATVVVTNQNVPVLGTSYGWYYADGNALVLTAIPTQIVGTLNGISSATVSTTTAWKFAFGITNNSGSSQIVNYGYTRLG